jgi:hypothetical protein
VKTAKNVGMSGYPGKIGLLDWNASSRYLASAAGKEAVLWDFSGTARPIGSPWCPAATSFASPTCGFI